ncbi:unnamed protein product [Discosporangium mesarthrocarpum]
MMVDTEKILPTATELLRLARKLASVGGRKIGSSLAPGVLLSQNLNLSGNNGVHSGPDTAALVKELAAARSELFSDKICSELTSDGSYVDFVRTVLGMSPGITSMGNARRADVITQAIRAMHRGAIVDRAARDLLGVVLVGLDDINPIRIPYLTVSILKPLLKCSKQRKHRGASSGAETGEGAAAGFLLSLELLPKLLSLVSRVGQLPSHAPVPARFHGISGTECKDRVISWLCRAHWPGPCSIGICQTLRDMDLGERQLAAAVGRVLRHLRGRTALHDMPPLIYQLLVLAGKGCKEAVLEGVIQVFDRLDAEIALAKEERSVRGSLGHVPIWCEGDGGGGGGGRRQEQRGGVMACVNTEELRYVEGTVILHFNFAMKQDHALATCLLQGFRKRAMAAAEGVGVGGGGTNVFTPFRLALLLSMARIQRFCAPVIDLVEEVAVDRLVYSRLREGSAWLSCSEKIACSDCLGRGGEGEEEEAWYCHRPHGRGGGGVGVLVVTVAKRTSLGLHLVAESQQRLRRSWNRSSSQSSAPAGGGITSSRAY